MSQGNAQDVVADLVHALTLVLGHVNDATVAEAVAQAEVEAEVEVEVAGEVAAAAEVVIVGREVGAVVAAVEVGDIDVDIETERGMVIEADVEPEIEVVVAEKDLRVESTESRLGRTEALAQIASVPVQRILSDKIRTERQAIGAARVPPAVAAVTVTAEVTMVGILDASDAANEKPSDPMGARRTRKNHGHRL